jgi:tetratricopeptide (TPR) repeat protein
MLPDYAFFRLFASTPKHLVMKKYALSAFLLIGSLLAFSQEPSLDDLLREGVELHDKGDFTGALKKYDEILSRNDGFYLAYIEKSVTLFTSGKNEECIELCKKALKRFPDSAQNKNIYVNYGSALDVLGKTGDAIDTYAQGMQRFPDYYLLPFNKGVTEYRLKKYDDAVTDLERSVTLKPTHASSHLFLAYAIYPKNKIAAAMALSTFLVLEPSGQRAENNLKALLGILKANVQKKDEKNITISLSPAALDLDNNEKKEDDFRSTELLISFSSAADLSSKDSLDTMKQLEKKLEFLAGAAPQKKGFFTNYYVAYLSGLKKNNFVETAAYLIYYASKDSDDHAWLASHKDKLDALTQWTAEHLGMSAPK